MRWLKSLLGLFSAADAPVSVGGRMPEPEAHMWAEVLRSEGIGAGVRNEGLPPYTSSMSSNYSVWVQSGDAERARQIVSGEKEEGGKA